MTRLELVPVTIGVVAIIRKSFPRVDGPLRVLAVLIVMSALELFANELFEGSPVAMVREVVQLALLSMGSVFLADRVAGLPLLDNKAVPSNDAPVPKSEGPSA